MTHHSRRTFLRGMVGASGVRLALPLLESVWPGRRGYAAVPKPPTRLMIYYVPNGMIMGKWRPNETGAQYTLSPTLAALEPHKGEILVVSGLDNAPAGTFSHAPNMGALLTAVTPNKMSDGPPQAGVSFDQVAAAATPADMPFRSLHLGIQRTTFGLGCEPDWYCAYTEHISWQSPASPIPNVTDPRLVFDRLFRLGQVDTGSGRRSVLDYVRADAQRLSARASTADRARIDQYLTSVRELERRLDAAPRTCQGLAEPGATTTWEERVDQMLDLAVVAFQCDVTRILTFMQGHSGSVLVHKFLGVTTPHHQLTHSNGIAELEVIERWELTRLARLLDKMRAVKEEGGTLLDNSAVLFLSDMSDAGVHSYRDLPIVLAGRAGGALAPGRHLQFASGTPFAGLLMTLLQIGGVKASSFGMDGKRTLNELSSEKITTNLAEGPGRERTDRPDSRGPSGVAPDGPRGPSAPGPGPGSQGGGPEQPPRPPPGVHEGYFEIELRSGASFKAHRYVERGDAIQVRRAGIDVTIQKSDILSITPAD